MKLGLSSYAYGWAVSQNEFGEHDLLNRARDFGLELVQFGDHIPLVAFSSGRLATLKSRAHDAGIALEMGGRTLTQDNLSAHIALCEQLDSSLLRMVIDGADFEPTPQEVVAIVRGQLSRLEGSNVTLGIENHDRFSARVLQRMIEEIASPHVGICLDTANSLGAGEGLGWVLQVLAPHTVNLHLKDFAIARVPYLMGFTIEGRPAGAGMMNAPEIIQAIEPFGRCLTAVVETWTPPEENTKATLDKERAWAQASVKYLRGLQLFV